MTIPIRKYMLPVFLLLAFLLPGAIFSQGTANLSMEVFPPGFGTVTPDVGTYAVTSGELQLISAMQAPGCRFMSWSVTGGAVVTSPGLPTTTVRLTSDATVTAIFASVDISSVVAWGRNNAGQLGGEPGADSPIPATVPDLTDALMIAGGGEHSLALLPDGTVRAWGGNGYGQCSDGSTATSISGLENVVMVAAGWGHSLALLSDGTVRSWGVNGAGQLGDGTTINRFAPVTVSGLWPGAETILASWEMERQYTGMFP